MVLPCPRVVHFVSLLLLLNPMCIVSPDSEAGVFSSWYRIRYCYTSHFFVVVLILISPGVPVTS